MAGPGDKPRRPVDPLKAAEAMFAPKKPELASPTKNRVPVGKETVSLRLDRDVLDFFQDEGPGWQERINDALRKVAGLEEGD
jgi:uncharacterized protein (DUF4415 family)